MDDGMSVDGNRCHRPGKDIVVPQYLSQTSIQAHHDFVAGKQLGLEYRMYDSMFAGYVWPNRKPLEHMAKAEAYNYIYNHTEHYLFSAIIKYAFIPKPLDSKLYHPSTYYMYSPCGQASSCWSARMYDGMAYYIIPILINTGAINAFERYFNWTLFTCKMNLHTFESPLLSIQYRQKLRIEVDLVRSILEEYKQEQATLYTNTYTAYNNKYINYSLYPTTPIIHNNFKLPLDKPSSTSISAALKKLLQTSIYKKLSHIKHIFPWFLYHETGEVGRPNAYRLITLEMWCQVAPAAVKPSTCSRPVNTISQLEYV